ncbi:hypothetical protein C8Q77DRAFT_565273 [Trametes polyzona]|nr:hypothetical protein C8Q77DRAFT_565273 [Trametes polyzona]
MFVKTFFTLMLPVLSANAMPAPVKRDGEVFSSGVNSIASSSTNPTTVAAISVVDPSASTGRSAVTGSATGPSVARQSSAIYASMASSRLSALRSQLSAVDPSGTAYTAFITTVSGQPAVEMSAIGGVGNVVFVAATATPTALGTTTAPEATATTRAQNAAVSTEATLSLPSGGPELSSALSALASSHLEEISASIKSASKTAELTAYFTDAAGTPVVALSSVSGPAVTLAVTTGGDAFTTVFDGLTVTAIPSKNSVVALSVSSSLLVGIISTLVACSIGAILLI